MSVLTSGSERLLGLGPRRLRLVRLRERSAQTKTKKRRRSAAGIVESTFSNHVMRRLAVIGVKTTNSAMRSQWISNSSLAGLTVLLRQV